MRFSRDEKNDENNHHRFSLDLVPSKSLEFLKIENSNRLGKIMLSENFFTNFQFIRWLQFEKCNFSNIPNDALKNMINLEVLEIEHAENVSHIVFAYLFKFGKLKAFTFSSTKISKFDCEWLQNERSSVRSLRYLRFENLESLKGQWSKFENLLTLDLSYNTSIKIQQSMFNGLASLKSLNMSNCEIKRLPNGLFSPLVNLRELNLLYNFIEEINENTFNGLENLRELDLYRYHASCSELIAVNEYTYNEVEMCRKRNLPAYNKADYQYLSIRVFSSFKNLEKLTLNHVSNKLKKQLKVKFPNLDLNGGDESEHVSSHRRMYLDFVRSCLCIKDDRQNY